MSDMKQTGIMLAGATEAAARAVQPYSGKMEKNKADAAAVEAMRGALNAMDLKLHVLLGEGEKDKAPMLYSGERLGLQAEAPGTPGLDLVVDPLECTTNFARGLPDSLTVLLAAPEGTIQRVPGTYMEQLLVPPAAAELLDEEVNLETPVGNSIRAIAEAMKMKTDELTVVVQDRPRHKYLLEEIREVGAGVALIDSGSLSASFEIMFRPNGRLHVLWGTFGAPEGVVLAFMARAAGCGFLGRVMPHNARAEREAKELQLEGRTLRHDEFVQGDGVLVMSGVHSSTWLRGVETLRAGGTVSHQVQTVVVGLDGMELCLHRDGEFTESNPYRFPSS